MSQQKSYDFNETLPDLDAGVFLQKVSRAFQDVALAVANHPSKVTGAVRLEFKLSRIGDSSQINVEHKVSNVVPHKRGKSTDEDSTSTALYVSSNGALSIIPDNQAGFDFQKETEQHG